MEKNWVYFADKILSKLADIHPGVSHFSTLMKIDDLWQDHKSAIREGFDFLVQQELIRDNSNNSFICTPLGLSRSKSGISDYIKELEVKVQKESVKEGLTLELLNNQIKEIRRKNKYWRIAAIAGVISFILNILQIFKII